ncbi:MAG TPA: sigma-54 dependent transcriptional regulator [Hyphomicrobiaceae bacterium]|nr:sigma-54 dependent transcriptional regulator [Hyphomicrobiaceae bacterium]
MTLPRGNKHVLVVEDDRTLNRLLLEQLRAMGYAPLGVHTWAEAKATLVSRHPVLAILDVKLPDADGMSCIADLSQECPVIVLTAFGSIKHAVEAMRAGAFEYLAKPVNPSEFELAVKRVLETSTLKRSYEYIRDQLNPAISKIMFGQSPAFKELVRMIELVSPSESTVLIQGESGVGKELVAKSIHQLSRRSAANFVPVDATTLQETLFESELFGHEKGAFTGADRRKEGLIEVAEGGTLFLDEIGELHLNMQGKLLRVLETGEFRRVGGTQSLVGDIRFVAATNRDLRTFIDKGQFRQDLYYRLSAVVIHVPPLRERREDISYLAEAFLENRSFQRGRQKRLSRDAIDALTAYEWPGNIRELRNVVERAILVSGNSDAIHARDLGIVSPAGKFQAHTAFRFDHEPTLEELKRAYIARLVAIHHGHRARIAEILGISERNTYRLLKKYDLDEEAR